MGEGNDRSGEGRREKCRNECSSKPRTLKKETFESSRIYRYNENLWEWMHI